MANLTTLAMATLISSTAAQFPTPANSGCARSGCGGEVCIEAGSRPVVTACHVTAQSACYQYSTCTKDSSGTCGWQHNTAFDNCMNVAASGNLDKIPTAPDTSATTPSAAVQVLDYNQVGPTGGN